jgi:hypothetical protein
MKTTRSNPPSAGAAGRARLFDVGRHRPGAPDSGRSAAARLQSSCPVTHELS